MRDYVSWHNGRQDRGKRVELHRADFGSRVKGGRGEPLTEALTP